MLRVGFVVAFDALPSLTIGGQRVPSPGQQPLFGDSAEYLRMAGHILAGRGPIVSDGCRLGRMPGYAFFLAAVQWLFGPRLLAVRLVQAVLATGTVAVAAWLARELFGRREAVWVAVIAAVYPTFILYTGLVLTETLFALLLLGGLACLLRAVRRGRAAPAAWAGLLFGLATLVRASFLPGVLVLAVAWVALRPRVCTLAAAACLLLAVAATLVPWVARNQIASSGHVVVTTSRAGASLYEALNPKADGGPMLIVVTEVPHPPELDEVERDRQLRALAVRYAREHPGRALWLGLVKFARTWNVVPNAREFRSPLLAIGLGVPYVLVMLGAALGVWRAGRRGEVALILLLPVVYYALLHTVFVGSIRYRMPVMPLLVALAAHGVCARGRGQPSRPRSVDGS